MDEKVNNILAGLRTHMTAHMVDTLRAYIEGLEAERGKLRETLIAVTNPDGSPNLKAKQVGAAESYRMAAIYANEQREAAEARVRELEKSLTAK